MGVAGLVAKNVEDRNFCHLLQFQNSKFPSPTLLYIQNSGSDFNAFHLNVVMLCYFSEADFSNFACRSN